MSPLTGSTLGWAVKVGLFIRLEVGVARGFQGSRVHGHRRTVLLQRVEDAAVAHHIGVGGATIAALDALIVGEGVAVGAEQGALGLALQHEFVGADPALFEVDLAAAKAEHRDRAVAVEGDVVTRRRGELRIRLHAIEGAVDLVRKSALDLQVQDLALEAQRGVEARERRDVRELGHGVCSKGRSRLTCGGGRRRRYIIWW